MSVARCQEETDSYDFAEWKADSLDWEREDNERAALICRELVNNRPFRAKFAPLATIDHFMPRVVDAAMSENGATAGKTTEVAGVQDKVLMKAEWERAQARWPKPKEPRK